MSTQGDLKKILRAAKKRGWTELPLSKSAHIRLEWTNGRRITVSATPSDSHAVRNVQGDMRRVERQ